MSVRETGCKHLHLSIDGGNYIKAGPENDANWFFYCLVVQFNSNSEERLTPNRIYSNVGFDKVKGNLSNVFLIAPLPKEPIKKLRYPE